MKTVGIKAAARMLGVTPGTLYNWRSWGIGPRASMARGGRGRPRVVFLVEDIEKWLADERCPTCGQRKLHRDRGQS